MALTLSEYDVQYPPKHKMPKEQGGFRLCKLIQYPERTDEDGTIRPQSEWLMTTAFSTTMEWKGITISASVWSLKISTIVCSFLGLPEGFPL